MLYTSEDRHPLLLHMHSSNLLKIKTTSSVTKNIVRVVPFTRVRLKKLLLTFTFAFFTAAYIIYVTSPTSHFSFPQLLPFSFSNENLPYLINTSTCQVRDWPLFDSEILPLFENLENVENFGCDKDGPLFTIERVNFTWIFIGFPKTESWSCNATELGRASASDGLALGPTIENLEKYTNFDRSQMDEKVENGSQFRWDSVKVNCRSEIKQENNKTLEYSRVVPLVQQYQPKTSTNPKPKINIMLLGIDSVSRLNFLRHMHRTKAFLDDKGFIPLFGHHKVGENSFPNILPMLTGHLSTYYYNDSQSNDGFKFDNIRMIFKDAAERGYLTTFIEDMPPYGFFTVRGGFTDQPTHYYLRPTNLAIWDALYYTYTCYQDRIEHEIYWDYLLDLYQAIRLRSNSAHFTLAHMSTLTHNFFNHAGYADRPFSSFLERLFSGGHHQNSVIMVYSDHALRFGSSVNTTANVHEQRLPLFYMYIPDSLELDGLNADQLRAIVVGNQHRLTSHLDMHATMMHLLTGNSSQKDSSFRGRSLLTPISLNRTCASAGILPQYCLCDAYEPISLTENMRRQSHEVVLHINRLMSAHGNFCVPLETGATYRAFDSTHSLTGNRYRLLHFSTRPNEAIFEAIVRIESHGGNAQKGGEKIVGIENISRLTRYGDESSCVADKLDILQFCLCWEQLKEKEKEKEG